MTSREEISGFILSKMEKEGVKFEEKEIPILTRVIKATYNKTFSMVTDISQANLKLIDENQRLLAIIEKKDFFKEVVSRLNEQLREKDREIKSIAKKNNSNRQRKVKDEN